ncbi:hypothetical protein [Luteococcus sediminum]
MDGRLFRFIFIIPRLLLIFSKSSNQEIGGTSEASRLIEKKWNWGISMPIFQE